MNTLTCQGYTARIDFDDRDNIFVGRILGMRDIISFHGETVSELKNEFERTVQDYLQDCEEQGLRPEKPVSGKILLRVTPEMHNAALVAAQAAGVSLNQWITDVLHEATRNPAG